MTETLRVELDVVIREVVEGDLAGFQDWYGTERDGSFRRSYERHSASEIVYLVAEVKGKPVGHLGVDFTRVPRVAMLWQFGVLPPLQSFGIGSAMVRRAEQVASERGFAVVEIGAETCMAVVP